MERLGNIQIVGFYQENIPSSIWRLANTVFEYEAPKRVKTEQDALLLLGEGKTPVSG